LCHGFCAEEKNGPAASELRSLMRMTASWFGSWTHRIQGCGAIDLRALKAGSPLIVIPTATNVPPCSELSRYGPGKGIARGKVGVTANLDSSCARRLCNTAGRDEETGFPGRTKKRLTIESPYKAQAAPTVRLKVPMRRRGADCLVVATKWGNAHGAKGVGHRR